MRIGPPTGAVLGLLFLSSPLAAQTVTRGDQTSKPTTAAPRSTQSAPSRTLPSTLPVDAGSLGASPAPVPGQSGPSYAPASGGVRTVRPRRQAEPTPDPSGEEIPYVDPPAAPGYESAGDQPSTTTGGKPAAARATAPTTTAAAAPAPSTPTATAPASAPPPPPAAGDAAIIDAKAAIPSLDPLAGWIALGGLAAMLAAAAMGLRHLLTAPHLSFRVTVDHGVQSAPRFRGAAS